MTSPAPTQPLQIVPDKLSALPRIEPVSLNERKYSVAYLGLEKTGKTHNAFSWPTPIVAAYTDVNTDTAEGFKADGREIELLDIKDWATFHDQFLPAVVNREFNAATIVVDSYTLLSDAFVKHKNPAAASNGFAVWDSIKQTHIQVCSMLNSARHPRPGKPSYNIIVTAHLTDVTNKDGALLSKRPAIQGAFKDIFGRVWGTVLICQARANTEIVNGRSVVTSTERFCYSMPPSDLYACGDGVGGKGGHKELPAIVDGTYPGLMEAWRGSAVAETSKK